jgi:hypothetical protein
MYEFFNVILMPMQAFLNIMKLSGVRFSGQVFLPILFLLDSVNNFIRTKMFLILCALRNTFGSLLIAFEKVS